MHPNSFLSSRTKLACSSSSFGVLRNPGRFARPSLTARRQWRVNSQPERPLFKRERETSLLDRLCNNAPVCITVILGPRSCGKSTIVSRLKDKKNAVYIDCRYIDYSTPTSFVRELSEQLLQKAPEDLRKKLVENWPQYVLAAATGLAFGGGKAPVFDVSKMTSRLAGTASTSATEDLKDALDSLKVLLDVWEKQFSNTRAVSKGDAYKWPVLVIDEANKLMAWTDEYPRELAVLMSFLVTINKQSNRCHVLMVTSEYRYQGWLDQAIGPKCWRPQVIGNFLEGDAREFLVQELLLFGSEVTVDDHAWAKVFEVCGGNAGALRMLAQEVCEVCAAEIHPVNWDLALKALWRVEMQRISARLLGGKGFTGAMYADVAVQLLEAKHHTAPEWDIQERLGRHVVGTASRAAGAPLLERMMEANAFDLRPYSAWAQDIPAEAFPNEATVVSVPSTMDLYCLRIFRGNLEKVLKEWEDQQKAVEDAAEAAALREKEAALRAEVAALRAEVKQLRDILFGRQ